MNLVLLALLILFYGIQQRTRQEPHFRLWLVGWSLIFYSMLTWELQIPRAWIFVQEAVRWDLLLLGGVCFMLAALVKAHHVRVPLGFAVVVAGTCCLGVDLQLLAPPPYWVHGVLVVAGEVAAATAVWRLVPREQRLRRAALLVLIAAATWALLVALRINPDLYQEDFILAQVFLGAAVLYAGATHSQRIVQVMGTAGLVAWAGDYIATDFLHSMPNVMHSLYAVWDVPKYCVAFAMTLEVFEEARSEAATMAARYRVLYEDFRLLYEGNPHPMWIFDERSRRILSVNRAALLSYGYAEPELRRMRIDDLDVDAEGEGLVASEEAGTPPIALQRVEGRRHHRLKNGRVLSVDVTERGILFLGEPARFMLAVDVTEQERESQELQRLAQHDPLTGLPNRRLLEERLQQSIEAGRTQGLSTALLTIDLDHFKRVNDLHGHPVGDAVLQAVAQRLQSRIRQADTLARTGGEEFTAVIGGLSGREDAEKVAAALLRVMQAPITVPGLQLELTISIGGALAPQDGAEVEALRLRSDEALYAAKHQGRNQVVFCSAAQA